MKKYLLLTGLFFAGFISQIKAQDPFNKGEDSLAVENLRIENLNIADKPEPVIPVSQSQFTRPALTFRELNTSVPFTLPHHSLRIPAPLNAPMQQFPSRYARIGGGSFGSSLADLYWYNGRNRNIAWGADIHHLGMSNGFVPHAEFLTHTGNGHINWFINKHIISGKINVHHNDYHHYGDPLLNTEENRNLMTRRNWLRFNAEAGIKRNEPQAKSDYEARFRFRTWSDNRKNTENHFSILLNGKTRLQENLILSGIGEFTASGTQNFLGSQNRSFLHFRPTLNWQKERLNIEAGFGINYYTDTASESRFYPHADIRYEILKDRLQTGLEITGGMKYNTLYEWITENQYLDSVVSVRPSVDLFRANVFFSGKWAQLLSWKLSAYTRTTDRQPIYFSQAQRPGYFTVLYDTGFTQTGARLDLNLNRKEKWDAGASVTYNNNQVKKISHYFHQPAWRTELFISWIPVPALKITLKNYTLGERVIGLDPSKSPEAIVKAPAFSDLGLALDYRFYKRFSLFLEANNLAAQTYYRWYLYPERPLDFRAGLTAVF